MVDLESVVRSIVSRSCEGCGCERDGGMVPDFIRVSYDVAVTSTLRGVANVSAPLSNRPPTRRTTTPTSDARDSLPPTE